MPSATTPHSLNKFSSYNFTAQASLKLASGFVVDDGLKLVDNLLVLGWGHGNRENTLGYAFPGIA